MLIYDHTKTFIGLDEEDLRLLGFNDAVELHAACTDIADFFVKKPGYIHNFKNFEWIDFVLHADADTSRAIVHTGKKSFSCQLHIRSFYLLQDPEGAAYAVTLDHVKPLTAAEQEGLEAMPVPTPPPATPAPAAEPDAVFKSPEPEPEPLPVEDAEPAADDLHEDLPSFDDVAETTLDAPASIEIPDEPYGAPEEVYPDFNKPLEIEDDIFMTPESEPAPEAEPEADLELPEFEAPEAAPEPEAEKGEERPMLGDYLSASEQEYADSLDQFKDYVYDPHIAADELGLPVDLIEEFIGDFISQSHEFKDGMFEAAAKEDYENLRLLSHKLKGVAANLRIEDAFAMLATVNTSNDITEIEANLKMFYNVIAKLEGKEPPTAPAAAAAPAPEPDLSDLEPELPAGGMPPADDDDLYDLALKDEAPESAAMDDETPAPLPPADDDDLYDLSIKEVAETTPEPEEEDLYDLALPDAEAPETEPTFEAALPDPEPETPETAFDDLDAMMPEPEPMAPEFDAMEPDFASETPAYETPEAAAIKPFQADKTAMELGLSVDDVDELKNDFVDYANNAKEAIVHAIAMNDSSVWKSEALRFKGIADNLRMEETASLLGEIEASDDPIEAETLVARFYDYIESL